MAILIYENGSGETKSFPIQKEKITIGRHGENDLVLEDVFVSRQHATLFLEDDEYKIQDMDSSYGVIINGDKVNETALKYGDKIQLGNTIITFVEDRHYENEEQGSVAELDEKLYKEQSKDIDTVKKELEELKTQLTDNVDTVQAPPVYNRLIKLEETVDVLQKKLMDLEEVNKRTSTLYEVGKIINSVLELEKLLNLVMDLALQVMNAERGFIMLVNDKTGDLEAKVARNMGLEDFDEGARAISYGIANRVLEEKEPIMTADASTDPRFNTQVSVIMYNIRSVMCVPLKSKDDIIGVIYVDNRVSKGYFSEDDLEFLVAFANQASLAIENAKLYENIREQEQMRLNLQRYLPINLVDEMLFTDTLQLGGKHVKAAILFSDIKGFTSLSENLEPEETVQILNDYFKEMTDEVFIHEGTLDKYMGDGIMAFFGAPISHEDDSLRACKAAIAMMEKLKHLNAKWKKEGKPWYLEMKIGINTGEVVAGNVGSEKRMDYTVIGDAVNLASRLEDSAKGGEILISHSTYADIEPYVRAKKLKPIAVKGKSEPVQVYLVLDLKE
jgi:adenylate cyclase